MPTLESNRYQRTIAPTDSTCSETRLGFPTDLIRPSPDSRRMLASPTWLGQNLASLAPMPDRFSGPKPFPDRFAQARLRFPPDVGNPGTDLRQIWARPSPAFLPPAPALAGNNQPPAKQLTSQRSSDERSRIGSKGVAVRSGHRTLGARTWAVVERVCGCWLSLCAPLPPIHEVDVPFHTSTCSCRGGKSCPKRCALRLAASLDLV